MLVKTNQKTYDIRDLWPKKKKEGGYYLVGWTTEGKEEILAVFRTAQDALEEKHNIQRTAAKKTIYILKYNK